MLPIEKTHLKTILTNCNPTIKGISTVEVTITNTLEQEEIANNLQPLLKHLGDHLKNNNITIEYKFVEAEKKEIIYSPSDKFNYLSAKNPALIKLRETFALELE